MSLFSRIFQRNKSRNTEGDYLARKDTILAQIVATHLVSYPLHNEGCRPPRGAAEAWIKKLSASGLDESELMLLVADHKSRNLLLEKTWP